MPVNLRVDICALATIQIASFDLLEHFSFELLFSRHSVQYNVMQKSTDRSIDELKAFKMFHRLLFLEKTIKSKVCNRNLQ